MRLIHSRIHTCHNEPMIWQPAGLSYWCRTCSRREAPNEYAKPGAVAARAVDLTDTPPIDQPEPPKSA